MCPLSPVIQGDPCLCSAKQVAHLEEEALNLLMEWAATVAAAVSVVDVVVVAVVLMTQQ